MPYLAPEAAMPITSCAPKLADKNASPATQAGMERPAMKKSSLVRCAPLSHQPMPMTNTK